MKRLLYILFLCFCIIHAQEYKITFFGLPAVDVNMDVDENKINFSVQTVGLINLIRLINLINLNNYFHWFRLINLICSKPA